MGTQSWVRSVSSVPSSFVGTRVVLTLSRINETTLQPVGSQFVTVDYLRCNMGSIPRSRGASDPPDQYIPYPPI